MGTSTSSTSTTPTVEILYAVPVGAVIAWFPPAGAALPPGFAHCDGATVTDPDSPFHNHATPDLRTRFVLGAGGAAGLGDAGGDPNFALTGYQNPAIMTTPTEASSADAIGNFIIQEDNPVTDYRYALTSSDLGKNDGNHHHLVLPSAITVPAPGWMALLYIIRIK